MKNYYEILQVSQDASPEIIKAAYLVLIKKYHPDNNPYFQKESTEITNVINVAYSVLSNPLKRIEYDNLLKIEKHNSAQQEHSSSTKQKQAQNTEYTEKKVRPSLKFGNAIVILCSIVCIYFFSVILTDSIYLVDRKQQVSTTTLAATDAVTPLPLPSNGYMFKSLTHSDIMAPFRIETAKEDNTNYYIKLKNDKSGVDEICFFVRAGKDVDIDVPIGTYKLYYACGSEWYGEKLLFGDDTQYFKSDDDLEFYIDGNYVEGCSITLYPVYNGNFETEKIDLNEF